MSKRKSVTETQEVETTPPERVHKAGGQAEIVSGERWHILYNPQWRTQVDCGFADNLKDAQYQAIEAVRLALAQKLAQETPNPDGFYQAASTFMSDAKDRVILNWQQTDADTWIATGNDGVQETTLPLVTITRVGGAE